VKRRIAVVAAIAVAVVALLALRVVIAGRGALADGDAAMEQHRVIEAVGAWETAARWYLPLAPHVDEAYGRLAKVAASKDPRVALFAQRAIRSAALATRTLWQPHEDELAAANAAIAKLSADDPDAAVAGGADRDVRERWHAERLAVEPRPHGFFRVLAALGIACWLGGIAWTVRRGVSAKGQPVRRQLMIGAAIAIFGLLAWFLGLYNA
jgi:hypothetical protein